MPLLDHFHPPLSLRRDWHAFHHAWVCNLAFALNDQLPESYYAEPNIHFGVEIDVGAVEDPLLAVASQPTSPTWAAPAPQLTIPLPMIEDIVEVRVFDRAAGPVLAAAIELVSPANKDRPESRAAFVSKCLSLIQQGIGLIIVDIVTTRRAHLHAEILSRLDVDREGNPESRLGAASYRPHEIQANPRLDVWHFPLELGQPLATLPFGLRGDGCLPVDLESTYERTRRELRIPSLEP
jgi:hypothetical protein